ncbi:STRICTOSIDINE SYNTHASE-LIKE 4, strictosidine synthase-like 4 [Hibiscus trionum]|uniref:STRICTOSIDINE SYNTHASE-LIKE 4, strictosidine synthase-like 4 n=1 Tax=Hibiscus trionum TaxID=183268 RepID=A0A9W7HYL4_HIBTR|nr:STRICTOSIDINE SYNTHASE-LIKE 4, strictosidine synthase-like 4 [Hibiscus trionum]
MALIKHACLLLLVLVIAFALQIIFFSPISPEILELPSTSSSVSVPPSNNQLQEVIKLGEGFLPGPEDVAVDEKGTLYTATRDGWVRRLHRNGSWEDWMKLESNTLLGIATAKRGGLIVCDCEKGLLKFTDDGVTVLASHVNGSEIKFADDVIEASDGGVYFSVASTKFQLHNWNLDVLEAKPYGQLLKYDPSTEETSILLDGLYFANGVALSKDEDFLLVCESWRFRCLKHWLKGESKGKTEIFIENLPGCPDNINLAPDGSFWIALLQVVSEGTEFVHASRALKLIISNFPKAVELVFSGIKKKATVINVAADGSILKRFDDPTGTVISFVTSAVEFEDHLYLGSLNTNFVGKLPLK